MIHVEIITIGDELLIGQVIDTNSAWMAGQLNKVGFDVKYKSTVGDNEVDIISAIDKAFQRVDVVLLTGGIGPTKDDITKKTLCHYFNTTLVLDEKILRGVEEVLQSIHRSMNELTRNQAFVPENSIAIPNKVGTAPLLWFEKTGKVLVSMPGVPFEMKWAMQEEIIPRLIRLFLPSDAILHRTFLVANFSESQLALLLENFENQLPAYIRLAYLPTSGLIRLRLSGRHTDRDHLLTQLNKQEDQLIKLIRENIIAFEDKPIESLLTDVLKEKNLTLCVAESCTGGKMAHQITSHAGSSQYFKGGVVAYSNEVKINLLHANASDLVTHGAVSEVVVRQMAINAQQLFQTDCSIATSGIAGPEGGSEDKPVGTVWIAVCFREKCVTRKFHFGYDRENNIQRATHMSLLLLLQLIQSSHSI